MQPINPRFLLARRRAARYGVGVDVPAYVRRRLESGTRIGIPRESTKPIRILPPVQLAEEFPFHRWGWPLTLIGLAGVAGLLLAGY
ncbi:hypothetical protein [Castellaniella sp. UC4442_H9]